MRIWEKNEADIHRVLCANPDDLLQRLAVQLCSQRLIPRDLAGAVYDSGGSSKSTKVYEVLRAMKVKIKHETDNKLPFKKFCAELSEHLSLQHISTRMMKGMFYASLVLFA